MHISDSSRDVIVNEFNYVVDKMRGEKDPSKKLYYFSAAFGIVFRTLNVEFDPILNLVHFILQGTYSTINNRLNAIGQGIEVGVEIPANLFEKLEDTTGTLAKAIKEDANPLESLAKLSVIAYATSGNGFYLYQKGILKL